ncbi:acid phosphatase aph 3-phytase phyB [Penicillium hispanicum]|uniref:acid phosphatase aph 3-phytase phyB n=1 Tax=Penicillium hispanicum TaxID=1080232 RepID=UPI002542195E|nr:acid phosphatase aph 3-phytase phyB [Penicillium hispanicum]KAJ5584487.1 acid phosphatase aph 3-phytase phyB [Penicillium hispanicum]
MIRRHLRAVPSPSLGKGNDSGINEFNGDLTFFNDWTYYVPGKCWYNGETFSGRYAGLLDTVTPFFSSGYSRVINTARKFEDGFFSYNDSTSAALNVISESVTMGLTLDRIPFSNPNSIADIVLQCGYLTIKHLSCNATALSKGTYVCLILNEVVVPFNKCQDDPG